MMLQWVHYVPEVTWQECVLFIPTLILRLMEWWISPDTDRVQDFEW